MNKAPQYKKLSQKDNSSNKTFFLKEGVKERKDERLKNRLKTLILARGLSEPEFFHKLGLTRQYWYTLSWGLYPCPKNLKIKIAEALSVDSSVIWGDDEPSN